MSMPQDLFTSVNDNVVIKDPKPTNFPIKNACMSCRSLKVRCGGGQPCYNCQLRKRSCLYRPSRRGGARVRRHKDPNEVFAQSLSELAFPEVVSSQPGAGLNQLPDLCQDSDSLLDSLFASSTTVSFETNLTSTTLVRVYNNDQAILDAYYIYLHPFFPILPAPERTPVDHPSYVSPDSVLDFESSSSLGLALSAILALVPCFSSNNDIDGHQLLLRRRYAHFFAQSAIEAIENEKGFSERTTPAQALADGTQNHSRQRFHHLVSEELEDVIALSLLSFYEYAQRGNLKKMQNRANQALICAMNALLHQVSIADHDYTIKARIWWLTYIASTQAAIVSNSEPSPLLASSNVTTPIPFLFSDLEAFEIFIQAQKTLLACTRFAGELVKRSKAEQDITHLCERMRELDLYVQGLLSNADGWSFNGFTASPIDFTEEVASRALRCMAKIKLNSARIKIHRYCAFFDDPIFPGRFCDLGSRCSSSGDTAGMFGLDSQIPDSPTESLASSFSSMELLPFDRQQSTKICLKSALNIVAIFNELPIPNPSGLDPTCSPVDLALSTASNPRLMPSLACCAMQCTYTLAMVRNRMVKTYSNDVNPVADSLLLRLNMGLMSITNIFDNYSNAFEAIGGMRGIHESNPGVPQTNVRQIKYAV